VLENIKTIVREEMNAIGGKEVMMTTLQPREIWEKTDRWDDKKVDNWFKTKLTNGTELGVGLTHEEPVVDALSAYVNSYKDLPILVYQIQNKFRNELRAKSGLLRAREFVMKDMYSLARTQSEHDRLYEKIAAAYHRIYQRLGIGDKTYRTYADGGIFTSRFSDEFQTLSEVGEDTIYVDEDKRVAINKEIYSEDNLAKIGLDKKDLVEKRSVEVGNIFPLESKYTDALGVYYTDESGQKQSIIMGCYGVGISRLMGTIAEYFADNKGLVWPDNVSPAQVHLISLGDDQKVIKQADELYSILTDAGISLLYDNRNVRPGEKFADADLIGIPHRVVISASTVAKGTYEWKARTSDDVKQLSEAELLKLLKA
jgi:prolyl-tRNA synthetase